MRFRYYFTVYDILIDRVNWKSFKQIALAKFQSTKGSTQQPCIASSWVNSCISSVIEESEETELV